MNENIILFDKKSECCGCGACMNKCSKGAIQMLEDEEGFIYPHIDREICIGCGMCLSVCGYKNHNLISDTKSEVYAFASKDRNVLTKSASGGAFAELAKLFLNRSDSVVYGAASFGRESEWKVKHIRISCGDDIEKLQGSKYVQSEMGMTYVDVKKDLLEGRHVLFSGTPCQIGGLYSFLGGDYDNLLTADIICHGVPSHRMFADFLHRKEKLLRKQIDSFCFRDKSKGQGMISRMDVISNNDKHFSIIKKGELYSYFYLFLKQHIYRTNCYSCPYAQKNRISDITLGDFWGFSKIYPDAEKKTGLTDKEGVSCVLANTLKGSAAIANLKDSNIIMESAFEKASLYNGQLKEPSKKSEIRERILNEYKEKGYDGVEEYYNKHFYKDRFKYLISSIVPMELKRKIRETWRI